MDYWPFGIIALLAIVFGGVSIFVVPLVGLIGIGMLGYYAWRGFVNRNEDPDNDPGR